MPSVYARFKGSQGWEYQKIGRGRPPKGAKFHIRFTDAQGKRRWSQPFNTPQDAQENAAGVVVAMQAAAQGLTVAEYQDETSSGITPVKIAVERFLKLHRNDRPKTVEQYDGALTHLLANLPKGVRSVRDLATPTALDTYLQTLQTEEYGSKTIETRMGVIFSMLKDNKKETGVEYASRLVSLPEPVQSRPKAYPNEDIVQLFGAMTAEEKVRYLFFLHTGCREQEVMYATWDDVDFKQRKYHVTGDGKQDVNFVPKNHEERWIPLTTELLELLKERKPKVKRRWIFVNEEGDAEGHFLRKFKAVAKRAGLNCGHCKTTVMDGKYHLRKPTEITCATRPVCTKHKLHRLRKTCATRWLQSGIDLMKIKTWLGHESLAVTQLYLDDAELTDSGIQAKVDRAGAGASN
jgi:integrase/recombinase XerD